MPDVSPTGDNKNRSDPSRLVPARVGGAPAFVAAEANRALLIGADCTDFDVFEERYCGRPTVATRHDGETGAIVSVVCRAHERPGDRRVTGEAVFAPRSRLHRIERFSAW